MIAERLKSTLLRIAEMNPSGFAFNPSEGRLTTGGYVVATSMTQGCIGKGGLFRVVKFYLSHRNYYIGGWKNEDGQMQFDASMVYINIEEAIQSALCNGQRAIFNLYTTGQEIMASDYSSYVSIAA